MRDRPLHAIACVAALGAAVALFVGACAPRTAEPPRGEWIEVARGETVRYLVLAGSAPEESAPRESPEVALARLEGFLDRVGPAWRLPERIDYYAFPNRETLRSITGWDITGRALLEHDAVVSIYASDAHEVAHVLSAPQGRPLRLGRFWLEGVAMSYTWAEVYFPDEVVRARGLPRSLGVWSGRSVHAWSRDALERGELPALAPLVHGVRAFDALDDAISYPAAGSFTTYLLGPGHVDLERIAAFRAFLSDANAAQDAAAVQAAFAARLGVRLDDAEASWHAFLRAWDEATVTARP
jgi:hypothetical protein